MQNTRQAEPIATSIPALMKLLAEYDGMEVNDFLSDVRLGVAPGKEACHSEPASFVLYNAADGSECEECGHWDASKNFAPYGECDDCRSDAIYGTPGEQDASLSRFM